MNNLTIKQQLVFTNPTTQQAAVVAVFAVDGLAALTFQALIKQDIRNKKYYSIIQVSSKKSVG